MNDVAPPKPKIFIKFLRIAYKTAIPVYLFILWYVFYGSRRNVGLLLYYFNAHHWPWWYGLNLWIMATGSVLFCFTTRKKTRFGICAVTLALIVAVTITHISPFYPFYLQQKSAFIASLGRLERTVIVPYFYAPVTDFFTDGTVTGRLFIVPVAAILLIGALLYWNRRIKKQYTGTTKDQGAES